MFLVCLNFFISFCSNLSISSIDTIKIKILKIKVKIKIKVLKIAPLSLFLFFHSLCFNYLSFISTKYFFNSKRLFLMLLLHVVLLFSVDIFLFIIYIFISYILTGMFWNILLKNISKKIPMIFWVISSNW